MDVQGRPKMSRALVQRLSQSVGRGHQPLGTVGSSVTPDLAVRRNIYRQSHLGASHHVRQVGAEIGGSRRQRGVSASPENEHLSTNQNRPSAGFDVTSRKYDPYA